MASHEAGFYDRLINEIEAIIAREDPRRLRPSSRNPSMGTGGVLVPSGRLFQPSAGRAEAHDTFLFIVDEVFITGFGRLPELVADGVL